MSKRILRGTAIYLHRNLQLSCLPHEGRGPAAIVARLSVPVKLYAAVADSLESGNIDSCVGGEMGVKKSVTLVRGNSLQRGARRLQNIESDVVLVFRPHESLGLQRLDETADRLLRMTFGGGTVYDAADLYRELARYQRSARRSSTATAKEDAHA